MNEALKEINNVALLFPSKYLKAADFRGQDVTLTIKDLDPRAKLQMAGGKSDSKPVMSFVETEKLFCLNKTNAKRIAKLYGPELAKWLGKRITLYPTTAQFGDDVVEAIRVREVEPKSAKTSKAGHDAVTGEVTASEPAAELNYTTGNGREEK